MRRMRAFCVALLALAASMAGPLRAAPTAPYWTFSVVGGWAQFDDELRYPNGPLEDTYHAGGRIGWLIGHYVGLEFAGGWSPAKTEVTSPASSIDVTFWHASGNIIVAPEPTKIGGLFLSAGGGYVQRSADATPDEIHFGTFELAGGWNAWFGDKAALRLEARNVLALPAKDIEGANKNDVLFLGGLTFAIGGRVPDTDADGVNDKKDKCPETPSGATVNAEGCPSDTDGDKVFDGLDQCANTATGARVDARGCPTDGDSDGVLDGLDKCDGTPSGATVDASGCPLDGDGDGVFDGLDQCANTPSGAQVDEKGCPKDSDGDGVIDGVDKCPGTAAGLKVDQDGCPIEIAEKETELLDTGMIRLRDVNFETGKAEILAESFPSLDVVGQLLGKWPELRIEIGGHTDSRGKTAYNQKLSEDRAKAVLDYLLAKFSNLKAEQFSSKGYGESKPVAPNNNPLNMAKNRRVEFVVLNKDVLKRESERRSMIKK